MSDKTIFINGSEIDPDKAVPISICRKAAKVSDDFEMENTELKRQYIVSNIVLYNQIISLIKESMGTFGTGYPFYALSTDLTGSLPIIDEQIIYDGKIYGYVDEYKKKILGGGKEISPDVSKAGENVIKWICSECLKKNGMNMPDLKKICNPCLNMDNNLKPRKLMARLPDLDMWTICKPEDIEKMSKSIEHVLHENGFTTSDVDPIKTIYDIESIVSKLQVGKIPDKKLPIDTHIIDNVTLYTLISHIPETLYNSFKNGSRPYLPILPLSLRKTWQNDDEAYNFVYDYLSTFSEFNFDNEIQKLLNETRREIAKRYSLEQLYDFMLTSGTDVSRRRLKHPKVKEYFEEKVESWREL